MWEKASARESVCVRSESRAGAGDDLRLPIHHKGTVALTQPNCSPLEGTDWEEVTLGAPLLRGTLWNNCCSSLPSFLGQVNEINDEKSLSFTSSFGEQEKKRLFPWKGWGGNVEVLTLTIYFSLGKCRVVPKPVHRVHGWQGSRQQQQQELWVRLCESIWVCFLRGLIKWSLQLRSQEPGTSGGSELFDTTP